MSKSKIFTIFMVLFLAQAAFGKSVDSSNSVDSSEEVFKNLTPKQRLATYVSVSVIGMFQEYSEKCMKLSSDILKDEDFLAHHEPTVVEFKQNLTRFVDAIDDSKDIEKMFDIVDMFSKTTDFYYEIPEDKHTPESQYIVEVMDKYHFKDIEVEMVKEFVPFADNLKKMFEEYKSDLEKPLLDWYEKYVHIDDYEQKLAALTVFLRMADD